MMRNSWRLNCICPGCGQGCAKYWYNDKYSCCHDNGWVYINELCNVYCDECVKASCFRGAPKFILY